jgi:hypothetical protein
MYKLRRVRIAATTAYTGNGEDWIERRWLMGVGFFFSFFFLF